jgi:hypothetical protein
MNIVYKTKFFCKFCNGDVEVHLYSDEFDFKMTQEIKKELMEYVDHNHWCKNHRVCVLCGKNGFKFNNW